MPFTTWMFQYVLLLCEKAAKLPICLAKPSSETWRKRGVLLRQLVFGSFPDYKLGHKPSASKSESPLTSMFACAADARDCSRIPNTLGTGDPGRDDDFWYAHCCSKIM